MANVPESSSFDAGIYQIETADPVLGGVNGIANAQAKGLANRTKYLNDQLALKAPIDSPALTGNPTAPTPATSENSTKLATTAWFYAAIATIATAAGFLISKGPTGYIKFPSWLGGLIIQWTRLSTVNGDVTWTFPVAFPNAAFQCHASVTVLSSAGQYINSFGGSQMPTLTSAQLSCSGMDGGRPTGIILNAFVIGY